MKDKEGLRKLTVCTAKKTRKTSLATKSLNFILRQELSSNDSTLRWNWALQVVQCEKANPSYEAPNYHLISTSYTISWNYASRPTSKYTPLLSANDQDMNDGQTVGSLCTCTEISIHPLQNQTTISFMKTTTTQRITSILLFANIM